MTQDKMIDPLVDGVKIAVVHFGKAAIEVVTGVGAVAVGVVATLKPGSDSDDDASGTETIEVE